MVAEKIADAVTRRALSRVGAVLRNKWTLDRLLGVGGMATVFAATHRNGKRGAVKMLHSELSIDEEARGRFLREGYVANKVDHPGAVSVLDDDVAEDGSVFLVMELLEGQTVDAIVSVLPARRLAIPETLDIADQLLDVLAAAHDRGIVHRDLKPENLFMTTRGELKVLDFGIARLHEVSGGQTTTKVGSAMGTPAFMPPEQALGDWSSVDARTDLWAVGATMFALLSGRLVHEADTVQKLLLAAMTRPAPALASVVAEIPPEIAAIVDRALAFQQRDRFPDARAMQRLVREVRAKLGGALMPSPPALPPSQAPSFEPPHSNEWPRGSWENATLLAPSASAALAAPSASAALAVPSASATLGATATSARGGREIGARRSARAVLILALGSIAALMIIAFAVMLSTKRGEPQDSSIAAALGGSVSSVVPQRGAAAAEIPPVIVSASSPAPVVVPTPSLASASAPASPSASAVSSSRPIAGPRLIKKKKNPLSKW